MALQERGTPADERGEEENAIVDFFTKVGGFLGGLFSSDSKE